MVTIELSLVIGNGSRETSGVTVTCGHPRGGEPGREHYGGRGRNPRATGGHGHRAAGRGEPADHAGLDDGPERGVPGQVRRGARDSLDMVTPNLIFNSGTGGSSGQVS